MKQRLRIPGASLAAWMTLVACGADPASPTANDPGVAANAGPAWFRESAAAAGIDFTHRSGADGRYLMPEIMTTGAALGDFDGDGDLDVYLVQADGVDRTESERAPNQLFLNRGDGTFENATQASGADDRGYGMAVATGDYDGDGDLDIYVSNLKANALLRNDGQARFTNVARSAGVEGAHWSAAAAFVDADVDGDLDLYVTNYVYWSVDAELLCRSPQGAQTYCSPKSYAAPAPDEYFENQGDGTFVDASERVGLRAATGNGLGVVCADFDLDGVPEILVANDGTPNQFWDPRPDGTFVDAALLAGCAVDVQGTAKAGMGVAAADFDFDGDEDLLIVNLTGEADSFYRNDIDQFVDRTPAVGLAVVSRRRTRFGVALRDFDLDGRLDLFEANGRVTEPPMQPEGDVFAEENVLLRGTAAGRFEEVLPRGGVAQPLAATSRAAAFGDIDGDGDVDILIHNRDGAAHLLVNQARARPWIAFDVRDAAGAPAIGAAVLAKRGDTVARAEVRTADSYGAASSHIVRFALGNAGPFESVEVRWPRGEARTILTPAVGEVLIVRP